MPFAVDRTLLSLIYTPKGESPETLALMRRIDELFLKYPFYGARQMVRHLRREGVRLGRRRAGRLMRLMGLQAIYRAPRTSDPHPEHRVYPYLLRGLMIERANHVWCADITYIPVRRGFFYLATNMDWASRHVLTKATAQHPECGLLSQTRSARRLARNMAASGDLQIPTTTDRSPASAFTGRLREACQPDRDERPRAGTWIQHASLSRPVALAQIRGRADLRELADGFARPARSSAEWIDFYNTERPHSCARRDTANRQADRGERPVDMMDKSLRALSTSVTVASTTARRSIHLPSGGMKRQLQYDLD